MAVRKQIAPILAEALDLALVRHCFQTNAWAEADQLLGQVRELTHEWDRLKVSVKHEADPKKPAKPAVPEPNPPGLEATIGIPLAGNRTTFRFQIANNGREVVPVNYPFANETTLFQTSPDGKTQSYGIWKENLLPIMLQPGTSQSWDIDINPLVKFPEKGKYMVWFEVGKVESNRIIVGQD